MINLRKLSGLPAGTRLRKIASLLSDTERRLARDEAVDRRYLRGLAALLLEKHPEITAGRGDLAVLLQRLTATGGSLDRQKPQPDREPADELRRNLNELRHRILTLLDIAPADWDMQNPGDRSGVQTGRCPGSGKRSGKDSGLFRGVFIDGIRSPFNVGSIFRTAEAHGFSEVFLSAGSADPSHNRSIRSSMGAVDLMEWRRSGPDEAAAMVKAGLPVFALELGGEAVDQFVFPRAGIVVVGSEELGVSPELLEIAKKSAGLVSIPLTGTKASLNVGVAFGILANRWFESSMTRSEQPRC
ncbi:MAG: TrmH family RNA methyltransferase [Spirochaetales bacterium]|nr:TrmH family RNA methyltransferase [Spirochaetales bacterium]MCF7938761.1 TrmH family RNA methyltransferase [Spirochaetales bacterium]